MIGWRGRIGYIAPGAVHLFSQEWDKVLPEGMAWAVLRLGMQKAMPDEFERVFAMYPSAAEQLARLNVDFIALGGPPIFGYVGKERTRELIRTIETATGRPVMTYTMACVSALKSLGAEKIVLVTPYSEHTEAGTPAHPEFEGLTVLGSKGHGLKLQPYGGAALPPYTAYRLAKEAIREHPEADAVFIGDPAWEVMDSIAPLERDLGKPVVSAITGVAWAALTSMQFHEPVRGYGRLLENL